eukprot:1782482-Rhodomonas_salina.1
MTQIVVGSFSASRRPGTTASDPDMLPSSWLTASDVSQPHAKESGSVEGPETKRETSSQNPTSAGPASTKSGTLMTCGARTGAAWGRTVLDATPRAETPGAMNCRESPGRIEAWRPSCTRSFFALSHAHVAFSPSEADAASGWTHSLHCAEPSSVKAWLNVTQTSPPSGANCA